jgi:hypothetical protein
LPKYFQGGGEGPSEESPRSTRAMDTESGTPTTSRSHPMHLILEGPKCTITIYRLGSIIAASDPLVSSKVQ